MPKLSDHEITEFLGERGHLARIATVRADGSPSVVPVWFIFEGAKVLITPRKHSEFLANLQRDPRVAITIDEEQGRYRKVLLEGNAEVLYKVGEDRKWDDVYRRIACRYIDEASADYYLTETKDQPRALIGIDRAQAKVTTWRMPTEDEPYSGIWAQRYYDAGTKMARSGSPATGAKIKISQAPLSSSSGRAMRKKVITPEALNPRARSHGEWLDLGEIARVELTSEDPNFPIEAALVGVDGPGWRAAEKGAQIIRIVLDNPTTLRRIRLEFSETRMARTQEFTLRWSDAAGPFREIVRQQWSFSPQGSTSEVEDYQVELQNLLVLELALKPDLAPDNACASLAQWRVA